MDGQSAAEAMGGSPMDLSSFWQRWQEGRVCANHPGSVLVHSGLVGKAADSGPFHVPPYDLGLKCIELSPSEISPEWRPSDWAVFFISLGKSGVIFCWYQPEGHLLCVLKWQENSRAVILSSDVSTRGLTVPAMQMGEDSPGHSGWPEMS